MKKISAFLAAVMFFIAVATVVNPVQEVQAKAQQQENLEKAPPGFIRMEDVIQLQQVEQMVI